MAHMDSHTNNGGQSPVHELTEANLRAWREQPITQDIMRGLKSKADTLAASIATSDLTTDEGVRNAIALQEKRRALRAILDFVNQPLSGKNEDDNKVQIAL